MAVRNCTLQTGPADPAATASAWTITGSTVAGMSPVTLNTIATPTASFQANDGDVVQISGTQTNPGGTSPVSPTYFVTIAAGVDPASLTPPPPPAPAAPTLVSVTAV